MITLRILSTVAEMALHRAEDDVFWAVAMLAVSLLIYFRASKLRPEGKRKRTKCDYSKLPQFSKYDIENGYLLDVREGDFFEFTVDAALTYAHHRRTLCAKIRDALVRDLPPYTPTRARILIVFPNVRSTKWIKRTMRPNLDPDGSIDYGSIDEFTVDGEASHLSGEWGELEIVSDPVEVREILES